MKILLIYVGKTTDAYLKEGVSIYLKRLENYISVSEIVVPSSTMKEMSKAVEEESKNILSRIMPGDHLVVLDENGTSLTSRALSSLFQNWMNHSMGRVVFVIGGAFGLSSEIRKKANLILSLSSMTFTHQMVRLLLAEQLYRAMTILRNEKYHHD